MTATVPLKVNLQPGFNRGRVTNLTRTRLRRIMIPLASVRKRQGSEVPLRGWASLAATEWPGSEPGAEPQAQSFESNRDRRL